MAREWNTVDPYLVNRGNSEFQSWESAHWERSHDLMGFQIMRMDIGGSKVTVHEGAIRSVKSDTKALEVEMQRLLTYPELTADAKKLILAAIESQRTGKLEWSV